MPATPLTVTNRYFPPGIRAVYFVITIANYLLPTRAELNAGTDLTKEIPAGGMTGWSLAGSTVDTPDLGGGFTSQVTGRTSSASNSIDFYLSQNSIDARTLLPRNASGNIVCMWEGDVTGQKMDVFPVKVVTQAVDTATEDPAKVTIEFAITRIPAINVTIP